LGNFQIQSKFLFGFRQSTSFHQCSKLIFIYMLAEEQMDIAWEPSKSNALLENRHGCWI